MTLADKIRALRDRVLADLNAAHDYYADSKFAWDIVAKTSLPPALSLFETRSRARMLRLLNFLNRRGSLTPIPLAPDRLVAIIN
jgi:hypothetical protein